MNSRNLNVNQINTLQYVLSDSLPGNPLHTFVQKTCDSKDCGLEVKNIKRHLNHTHPGNAGSIIVAKTNQDHILCSYNIGSEHGIAKAFVCVIDWKHSAMKI